MSNLKDFPIQFASRGCNPGINEARESMWAWAEEMNIRPTSSAERKMINTRPETWISLVFPDASPELLQEFGEWLFWAFLVDDEFDDGPAGKDPSLCMEVIARFIAVFDGAAPVTPMEAALSDLVRRTCTGRSGAWLRQFRRDTAAWLWTYHSESMTAGSGALTSLDRYMRHRRESVAMQPFLDLHEICAGIELSEAARSLPAYQDLRRTVTDHSALTNDICSSEKEMARGYTMNSMAILQLSHDISSTEALSRAKDLLSETGRNLIRAEEDLALQIEMASLPESDKDGLKRCLEDYRGMARGDFDFHNQAERYNRPDLIEQLSENVEISEYFLKI
ncbi:terpene cyclase [Streptomyces sp. TX20-6-3]|uniref:terpene synthase family protein n=1 Tax=Streptomyces sp. TX20-6-3 TaxID=3028705 RepID=UPI0029BCCAE9|nr:terpene cyclase [Streptomyces sp. TX20-6-3]MDX2565380.1 terpene cyclase [Streptomyces sp. TX20-6-3]